MKYVRRTAGFIWTDYKTNAIIAKELKITPILDKLLEYKRNLIQYVNRMPRNRLRRVMKHYSQTSRRNHGRLLKRLLDTWDRIGSTSGPTPWQIYDDDDDIYIFCKIRSAPCFPTQGRSWPEWSAVNRSTDWLQETALKSTSLPADLQISALYSHHSGTVISHLDSNLLLEVQFT
jgi:hypothetical protein